MVLDLVSARFPDTSPDDASKHRMKNTLTSIALAIAGVFFILPGMSFADIVYAQPQNFATIPVGQSNQNYLITGQGTTLTSQQTFGYQTLVEFYLDSVSCVGPGCGNITFLFATSTDPNSAYLTSGAITLPAFTGQGQKYSMYPFQNATSTRAAGEDLYVFISYSFGMGQFITFQSDFYSNFKGLIYAGAVPSFLYTSLSGPVNFTNLNFPAVFSSSSVGIATSSGLWNSIEFASSTTQCADGNLFTNGICVAFSFLFVPDPGVMNGYAELFSPESDSGFYARFPITYFVGVSDALSAIAASSTESVPLLDLELSRMNFASSTFGSFIPDEVFISTTTIAGLFPDGLWDALQLIIVAGIWLGLITEMFFDTRNKLHHV